MEDGAHEMIMMICGDSGVVIYFYKSAFSSKVLISLYCSCVCVHVSFGCVLPPRDIVTIGQRAL